MPRIVYETLEVDDIQLIRPLWDRLRLLTRDITTHFKRRYEELDFAERFGKLDHEGTKLRIDVARDGRGGHIVGYVVGSVSDRGVGELDSFFVDERFRRRGIGARLLERSLGWITEQNPKECVVLTAYENREVLPLYEKFGLFPRLVMLNRKR